MSFGTLFQLIGAVLALIFAFTRHPFAAGICFAIHFAGDAIVGFLKPLDFVKNLEVAAKRFTNPRGLMTGVGWSLCGLCFFWRFKTSLLFVPITSFGVFYFSWMLVLVGVFVYDAWYENKQ